MTTDKTPPTSEQNNAGGSGVRGSGDEGKDSRPAPLSSNQIHELRVMASGMAGNVDEADDHSEVKLLRWAAAEIERLTRDLAMQKMLEDAMTDCIQPREGQTFEERAEELIVTEVQHQQCSADETTPSLALDLRSYLHGGPAPALHDGVTGKAKCVICGNFNRFWHVISACNYCQSCVSEALRSPEEPTPSREPTAFQDFVASLPEKASGVSTESCGCSRRADGFKVWCGKHWVERGSENGNGDAT